MALGNQGILKIAAAGDEPDQVVDKVKDVSISSEWSTADGTTRASNKWRENVPVLKDGSIEATLLKSPASDTARKAIELQILAAFDNGTPLAVFADDGDGKGIKGDFFVTNAAEAQPLEDLQSYAITFSPCCDLRVPIIVRA